MERANKTICLCSHFIMKHQGGQEIEGETFLVDCLEEIVAVLIGLAVVIVISAHISIHPPGYPEILSSAVYVPFPL